MNWTTYFSRNYDHKSIAIGMLYYELFSCIQRLHSVEYFESVEFVNLLLVYSPDYYRFLSSFCSVFVVFW